jgi:hypothetical protein
MLVIAVILLLGLTGVAVAAGQVPGSVSDGIAGLSGSGGPGSTDSDTVSGAAGNQYGPDTEADDDASEDQYGEDDEEEADDMHKDADEVDNDADEVNASDDDHETEHHADAANPTPPVNPQATGHDSDERGNDREHTGSVTNTNNTGTGSGAGRAGSYSRHESDD